MRHRSPRKGDQPTWRAELTVVLESPAPGEPAEREEPTWRAELEIVTTAEPALEVVRPGEPEAAPAIE